MVGISTPAPHSSVPRCLLRCLVRDAFSARDKSARSLLSAPTVHTRSSCGEGGREEEEKIYRSLARSRSSFSRDVASFLASSKASQPRLRRKRPAVHTYIYIYLSPCRARALASYVRRRATTDGLFSTRRDCTSCGDATRCRGGGRVYYAVLCALSFVIFCSVRTGAASAREFQVGFCFPFAQRVSTPLHCVQLRCFLRRGPVSAEGTKGDSEGGRRRTRERERERERGKTCTHTVVVSIESWSHLT